MKTKHLFWGFLFITIGVLILVNNLKPISLYWFNLWEFWPLFLILIGVSLLIKQEILKSIIISIIGIILGIAIFSTFKTGWGFFHNDLIVNFKDEINFNDKSLETRIFKERFNEKQKYASLEFEASAGSFKIADTTSLLFSAITKCYDNNYSLSRYDENETVKLHFDSNKKRFFIIRGKNKNIASISLNPTPLWKLRFDVGAAASEFDLKSFKVEDLNIDIGAASLILILGDLIDSAKVNIDASASSVEISIPENVGCELDADIILSKRSLEGFNKVEGDLYRTENFDNSVKKIYMNIESGVSFIKITRYSSGEWL